jgi:hypothetical protein
VTETAPAAGPRRILFPAAAVFAGAVVWLWSLSRGKWSDALIDSGREWIVPDALARGAMLYRDVVYWFGPLTPYIHAALFRAFGSTFATLVLAGTAAAALILLVLHFALRRVTGPLEAALWTALAVPALVFMPHAGGPLLGMGYRIWHAAGFSLLAVVLVTRPSARRGNGSALWAGAACAAAALCRLEWGLAAIAAVVLAIVVRHAFSTAAWKEAAAAALAFGGVTGSVIGLFFAVAGRESVVEDGHVLLTGLPEETRTFLVAFSGIGDWKRGLAELAYSSAMWAGAVVLIEVLVLWNRDRPRAAGRARLLAILLAVLALTALLGGASGAVMFSAAPLVSLAALFSGLRRPGRPASAALAAFGFLGLVLSYRRPFHIGDSAYVGPPLLFAFVAAAGLLRVRMERLADASVRRRFEKATVAALALLVAGAVASRASHYAAWEGAVIDGTGGWLSARREVAEEIASLARTIRRETSAGATLVVFPEGEIFNYLSGRPNPIRHKLYIPGYLSAGNEAKVLAELVRARPDVVVIWRRPTSEYGPSWFGEDYGRLIGEWMHRHYDLRAYRGAAAPARRNARFLVGFRRKDF